MSVCVLDEPNMLSPTPGACASARTELISLSGVFGGHWKQKNNATDVYDKEASMAFECSQWTVYQKAWLCDIRSDQFLS